MTHAEREAVALARPPLPRAIAVTAALVLGSCASREPEQGAPEVAGQVQVLIDRTVDGVEPLEGAQRRTERPPGESEPAVVDRVFDAFDIDRDGRLTLAELPPGAEDVVRLADGDGDGTLTRREIATALEEQGAAFADAVSRLVAELEAAPPPER